MQEHLDETKEKKLGEEIYSEIIAPSRSCMRLDAAPHHSTPANDGNKIQESNSKPSGIKRKQIEGGEQRGWDDWQFKGRPVGVRASKASVQFLKTPVSWGVRFCEMKGAINTPR